MSSEGLIELLQGAKCALRTQKALDLNQKLLEVRIVLLTPTLKPVLKGATSVAQHAQI